MGKNKGIMWMEKGVFQKKLLEFSSLISGRRTKDIPALKHIESYDILKETYILYST